jgi:hypothetical protein
MLTRYGLSDHHTILIRCRDSFECKFPSRYRMNISVLKEEKIWKVMKGLMEKVDVSKGKEDPTGHCGT